MNKLLIIEDDVTITFIVPYAAAFFHRDFPFGKILGSNPCLSAINIENQ